MQTAVRRFVNANWRLVSPIASYSSDNSTCSFVLLPAYVDENASVSSTITCSVNCHRRFRQDRSDVKIISRLKYFRATIRRTIANERAAIITKLSLTERQRIYKLPFIGSAWWNHKVLCIASFGYLTEVLERTRSSSTLLSVLYRGERRSERSPRESAERLDDDDPY